MSNEFDELIKDKVEEKEYAYTHKAWHKFCRKANIPFLSIGAKIALVVVPLAFVAAGIFFLVNSSSFSAVETVESVEMTSVVESSQNQPPVVIEDTMNTAFSQTESVTSQKQPENQPSVAVGITDIPSRPEESLVPQNEPAEYKDTVPAKPKPAVRQDKTQWKRVNVIDLDTVAPY